MFKEAAASVAFSIVTTAADGSILVRRGEDWRRSLHNATGDAPPQYIKGGVVNVARWLRANLCFLEPRPSTRLSPILHDHPARLSGLFLTLRSNDVDESRPSRRSDRLPFIMSMISSATCSFEQFVEAINVLAGCQMKCEKRQPPQPQVRLLGVHVDVSKCTALVSATSDPRRKLATITKTFLEATTLSPTDPGVACGEGHVLHEFLRRAAWASRGQAPACPTACAQLQHSTRSRTHRISLDLFTTWPTSRSLDPFAWCDHLSHTPSLSHYLSLCPHISRSSLVPLPRVSPEIVFDLTLGSGSKALGVSTISWTRQSIRGADPTPFVECSWAFGRLEGQFSARELPDRCRPLSSTLTCSNVLVASRCVCAALVAAIHAEAGPAVHSVSDDAG